MSSSPQETSANAKVESQSPVEAGTLGFSNAASISHIFAASPIHLNEMSNVEDVYFNGGDHGGEKIDGLNGIVQNGYGFSEDVDLNYASSPDMTIANAGTAGGPPANAYVPNPSSPGGTIGVPTDNPKKKPVPPPAFTGMNGFGGANGGGPSMIDAAGMPVKPKDSAAEISKSAKNHPRGESAWTTAQKLDSKTTTDANDDNS